MFFKIFLAFTVVPVVELALLIKAGHIFGVLNTVIIVLLTAVAGAYMVRLEGINVLYRLQQSMNMGVFPGDEMVDGAMILVAGALLLTPGFITDLIGFAFVFPPSRALIKKAVKAYLKRRMDSSGTGMIL